VGLGSPLHGPHGPDQSDRLLGRERGGAAGRRDDARADAAERARIAPPRSVPEHILTWLRLGEALRREGFRIGAARVEISDLDAIAALCVAQGVRLEDVRAVAAAHRIGAAAEVLARAGAKLPREVRDLRADLGDLRAHLPADAALRLERVRDRVLPAVASASASTDVRLDLSRLEGLGYYRGLAFRISFDGPAGSLPVIDGGVVSWTQELLADRKERLVASAIGSEAVCKLYAPG